MIARRFICAKEAIRADWGGGGGAHGALFAGEGTAEKTPACAKEEIRADWGGGGGAHGALFACMAENVVI